MVLFSQNYFHKVLVADGWVLPAALPEAGDHCPPVLKETWRAHHSIYYRNQGPEGLTYTFPE